jgi:phosphoribosylglycinamide formyltransferase 1
MCNIAIFASGSGTNAEQIIQHFKNHSNIHVSIVLSNKADAFVLERARNHQIPTFVFSRKDFYESENIIKTLEAYKINFIVLAGFLWLVPENLLSTYPGHIINIHPALLPAYGGKGMYGSRVHESVVANKDKESGITIHYVNKEYDQGDIIFQARCPIMESDTAELVAQKVHALEYEHFPRVINEVIEKSFPS